MRKGWEYKSFETCINKLPKPKQVKTSEYSSGTKYPIISQEDKLISGYYDDESYVFHIDSPVVIFGDHTRVLKYVDFDFVVGADGVKIISPKRELNAKFLLYYLQWYKIPNLGYSRHYKLLKEIKIPLPPKSTQLAIVSELDKINELIRLKKEQLKDFDNLAQSLFYEMFGDPVENEKGWEVKKLGELLKVIGGYAFKSDKYKDEGIPILRIGNINSVFFRDTNLVFAESDEKLERYKIFPGDIVISLTGTVGKSDYGNVCIMDDAYNFYYLNQRNAKLEIFGNLDKYYLSAILKNEVIKSRLTSISRGVRQANIANKDIENLQIPLPPLSLQRLFAQRIEQIDREKSEVQKSIQDLETLLASRMQYWFE